MLDRRIGARGDQAAETILGQVPHLDPPGQRFEQLLNLVNHPAFERGIGQEGFPFVRQIVKIGDDRMAVA